MKPDPLAELRDIHLPAAVSWWPPAVGWWMVLLIFILLVALGLWWRKRSEALKNKPIIYSHAEIIAAALTELSEFEDEIQSGENAKMMVADLSRLLRRSAMRLSEHSSDVAGLTGEAWLLWLDSKWDQDGFCNGAGRLLTRAQYQRDCDIDVAAVSGLCRNWLEAQR